ncbi:MAG: NPCBM/NEW2 domain-containing protein [Oscillospiraceae bacterium]|nr:NPCBM/NEW2 domain-containing protein [Oscillospiraceae bacterium]
MKSKKTLLAVALTAALVLSLCPVPAALAVENIPAPAVAQQLTPTMGWSSWNCFGLSINEERILSQADALVSTGLAKAGYVYLNIDDGYQNGRDPVTNRVRYNETLFPNGMKYIADYAHSLGLKAGMYSDAGDNTCGSGNTNPYGLDVGLWRYEEQDLRMYLEEWGYDYIKVDWCGGGHARLNEQEQYTKIGRIIRQISEETGSWKVFNVCRWMFPGEWVLDVADSWRTSGDINASWGSILSEIDSMKPLTKYAGPGHFNDPDMLEVGNGNLTPDQNKSHFSMWCMLAAPLVLGNDLTQISQTTLDILTNEEVVALDQDPAGLQASVAKSTGDGEVWVKDLGYAGSNTKAVAFFNRSGAPIELSINWRDIGLEGRVTARDLWLHDEVDVDEGYSASLPPHGIVVLKVTGEPTGSSATLQADFSEAPDTVDLTAAGSLDWYYFAENVRKQGGGILSGLVSDGAVPSVRDARTSYAWSDASGETPAGGGASGLALTGAGDFVELTVPTRADTQLISLYLGAENARLRIDATIGVKQVTDFFEGESGLYRVRFSAPGAASLTVRITLEETFGDDAALRLEAASLVIPIQILSQNVSLADKPAAVNLTEEGTGDWLQLGTVSGANVHRKATGGAQLSFVSNGSATGNYTNAAAAYSWTDGSPVASASGLRSGQGYGGGSGSAGSSYGQFNAPSDTRTRTVKAYVGGYMAQVRITVTLAGQLIFSDTIENQTGKVDRVVTVTYATDQPATLSIRWGVEVSYSNGSVSCEAITMTAVDPLPVTENFLFGSGMPIAGGDVTLDRADALDWVSFGGSAGAGAARKAGVQSITNYARPAGAVLTSAGGPVTYHWQGGSGGGGAALSGEGSWFEFSVLSPGEGLHRADVYFGVESAVAAVAASVGNENYTYGLYNLAGGQSAVVSLWFRSDEPLRFRFRLDDTFPGESALRLDAVVLSDDDAVVAYPTVTPAEGALHLRTEFIAYSGPAARLTAASYSAVGTLHALDIRDAAAPEDGLLTVENTVPVPETGTLRLFLWDSALAPLRDAVALGLPYTDVTPLSAPRAYIGGLTAKAKVQSGALLLDVRSPEAYEERHAEGAVGIPYAELLMHTGDLPDDKGREIVVYGTSAAESAKAALLLRYLGYGNVFDLRGLDNWFARPSVTLPTTQANRFATLPIRAIFSSVSLYDDVERLYSLGADSTIGDALPYPAEGIALESSDTVKVYALHNGTVYAEDEAYYDVYIAQPLPDVTPNLPVGVLTWTRNTTGWGTTKVNTSINGNPLRIAGHTFSMGIGTHAPAEIEFAIPEGATRFIAVAGPDDEEKNDSSWPGAAYTQYSVYIDGVLAAQSLQLTMDQYHVFDIEIPEDAAAMRLYVDSTEDGMNWDHADWALAGFVTPELPVIPNYEIDAYVSDLEWVSAATGWGTVRRDRSVDNNVLSIGGYTFEKGIGAHAVSDVVVAIPEGTVKFVAVAGCDTEVTDRNYFTNYEVIFDTGEKFVSPERMPYGSFHVFDIDIPEGAATLRLHGDVGVTGSGGTINYAHTDWGIAGFIKADLPASR